jgi:hypothetical protein
MSASKMERLCYWALTTFSRSLVPHIPRNLHVWMVSRASAEAARRGEW